MAEMYKKGSKRNKRPIGKSKKEGQIIIGIILKKSEQVTSKGRIN